MMTRFPLSPTSDFQLARDQRQQNPWYIDIDLSVARSRKAGTALLINCSANTIYIDQGGKSQTARIFFQCASLGDNSETPITVFPGFFANIPYTQFAIENDAQPAQVMRIIFGTDLEFHPGNGGTINVVGSVSIVDDGKSRTLANQAFSGAAWGAQAAGYYALCQLWNPVGSGKMLNVESVMVGCGSVTVVDGIFACPTSAQATFQGNPVSKYVGGANSVAMLGSSNPVAANSDPVLFSFGVTTKESHVVNLREPIVIPPGKGLNMFNTVVGHDLQANFEFFESPA